MHEQDFKQALRDSMAIVTPPPPMNESMVLDAAKRAVRRRRAMWASGASALAVVALATGVALAAPGTDRSGSRVGAAVTSTNPSDTEPDWPDGQTDATASSGPRYEQGVHLLNKLLEVVPQGYDSPEDLTSTGQPNGVPLRYHQAVWRDDDSWNYDARIPLVKAGELGSLDISVLAAVDLTGTDETPCALSISVLDPMILMPGYTDPNTGESCTEVTVAGQQVGVATKPGKMLVVYRHSDDTLVVLSQEALPTDYGYPGLTELPFTGEQLAELAADPRFRLD